MQAGFASVFLKTAGGWRGGAIDGGSFLSLCTWAGKWKHVACVSRVLWFCPGLVRGFGTLEYRLKLGDYVNPGALIARIGDFEVRSPVPGEIRELDSRDGSSVKPGDPLADLSADPGHVWEALRALYLVGQPADLNRLRLWQNQPD